MAEQNILALLFNLSWVLLEINQICDVDELAEGVLLDLLLCLVGSTGLGRLGSHLFGSTILLVLLALGGCWLFNIRLGNFAFNHSIFVKGSDILCTVFKSEGTLAMFEILDPVALVLATVGVIEGALAVAEAILPVANVSVPEELVVAAGVKPDVSSETTLQVIFPVTRVTLIG